MTDLSRVNIEIWREDFVVLFDWLSSVDLDSVPIRHRADKQALADLLSALEQTIPEPGPDDVDVARERVARDMEW